MQWKQENSKQKVSMFLHQQFNKMETWRSARCHWFFSVQWVTPAFLVLSKNPEDIFVSFQKVLDTVTGGVGFHGVYFNPRSVFGFSAFYIVTGQI